MAIHGSQTEKNLLAAFAGESQARNRYTLFAKKAREEKIEYAARIFESTAMNELAHAKRFFSFLEGYPVQITATYPAGKIGTTLENTLAAIDGENEEATSLYPAFADMARQEGFNDVAYVFEKIVEVEKQHRDRFIYLKEYMPNLILPGNYNAWLCLNCGFVWTGPKPPVTCPVCLEDSTYFVPYTGHLGMIPI